jgi:prepilin-type N-terminal cleavage/methylation domain-containing protein
MDIKGFTLIELMVILAIIGIVAVVVIPLYQNYVTKSQVMAAVAELKVQNHSMSLLLIMVQLQEIVILVSLICFFRHTITSLYLHSKRAR